MFKELASSPELAMQYRLRTSKWSVIAGHGVVQVSSQGLRVTSFTTSIAAGIKACRAWVRSELRGKD